MQLPSLRGESTGPAVAVWLVVVLTLVVGAPAGVAVLRSGSEDREVSAGPRPVVRLHEAGIRKVRAPIPITGQVWEAAGKHELVLQRRVGQQSWSRIAARSVRNGSFRFTPQQARRPGTVAFRTVLHVEGRPAAVSNVITVRIRARPVAGPACANAPSPTTCPKPKSVPQQRTVVEAPYCQQLTVTTRNEARSVGWRWDTATRRWVEAAPTPWTTTSTSKRPASAAECLKIRSQVPAAAVLPDLRIKDLTQCGKGDLKATDNTCFKIIPAAPYYPDFPSLEGRRLLKFPIITLNVGAGPADIIADRSAASAADWKAYQSFYDANGSLLGSVLNPGVEFYFAGDGHDHWHVRDFDDYTLLDESGTTVARAEKHGYCMQDNTTYTPLQGQLGVPTAPVYTDATSCGKGLPNALTIIHGLSRGWGDTYPTNLPDQAIDITGLRDGIYTVQVHADAVGAFKESNEQNNTAEVKVQITGDTVTVVPGSATGGI